MFIIFPRERKYDYNQLYYGVISEVFVNSFDLIYPFLLKLFNALYKSGVYPDQWSTCIIAPIFKKGNPEDTNNYRGITLTNIVAKIYSHVLNNRLIKWSKTHEKLTSNQFGFQPNRSTIDCIYIFHAIIMKTLNSHKKLFCAFVDFF